MTQALQERRRCSTPARAARRRRSSSAASATCCIAWENEAYLAHQGARPRQVRDRRPVDQHPRRAAGRASSTRTSTRRARARSPRPTSSISTRPKARRSRRRTSTARRDAKVAAKYADAVPEDQAVHHRRGVRRLEEGARDALRGRRRPSTRSTFPALRAQQELICDFERRRSVKTSISYGPTPFADRGTSPRADRQHVRRLPRGGAQEGGGDSRAS